MKKRMTRKEFLTMTVTGTACAAAGLAGLRLVAGEGRTQLELPPWPWPYKKLDPEYVRKLGHAGYWEKGYGCSYGAFHAIVAALREVVGYPYTLLPTELMIWGHGGVVGWGGTCGGLLGACAAIQLVCDKPTADKIIHELQGWYTQALFPSDVSNRYAETGQFFVKKYTSPLPQNASGSPLCHVSVTEWCRHAGFGASSLERKERCARLTGDVAARAVELLNLWADGQFREAYIPPESLATCLRCHSDKGMDDVKAKMDCLKCHRPH